MTKPHEGPLAEELTAFDTMKDMLTQHHNGKFVVIKGSRLIGTWDTLDAAAKEAVRLFGRGPYLIRQVGAAAVTLPASVMFRNLEPA